MSGQLERCEREWHELEGEFQELQESHRIYKQKLEELTALQTLCSSSINKQKTRLKDLKHTLQRYKHHASREEAELVQQIGASIKERQNIFFDMEAYLPKKNGLYLNLVLGNVNVTLLSNQAKFAYKDEYEKFKLYLTIILLLGAVMCRFVLHYRVTDEVFNFLLVWYYCTLTIRESILISNGSSGLLWQILALPGLTLNIEPRGCVQFLQYYYQRGCLYRLRALGERNHLDLTKDSSPGCGGASPSFCLSCSVATSGSSTMPSRCLSSPATRNAKNGSRAHQTPEEQKQGKEAVSPRTVRLQGDPSRHPRCRFPPLQCQWPLTAVTSGASGIAGSRTEALDCGRTRRM
ncbi:transmembrane protein 120B isoform X3 [Equus asinus]|uniref:transmembrane protein 120B isoform X3 n=1 Tax=Equus asinus TaxID=9793 RepID=UPI0038F7D472